MSTRYVKRDNVVLVGVAKNGSQAIKQVALRNDGFEIQEQQGDWNKDNFIDWDDSNLLILFPIRHWHDKAYSEMLEVAAAGNELGKTFRPRLNYFENDVMVYFIENILLNENWNGAQVRFFDLKHLSTTLPKYLGWDFEIPIYNTADSNKKKKALVEKLKGTSMEVPVINNIFFKAIKKSKYWIEL